MQALLQHPLKHVAGCTVDRLQAPDPWKELRGHQPVHVQGSTRLIAAHARTRLPRKLPEIKQKFSKQAQCEVGWCQPHPTLAAGLVLQLQATTHVHLYTSTQHTHACSARLKKACCCRIRAAAEKDANKQARIAPVDDRKLMPIPARCTRPISSHAS
jgi:hypothetical protein